MHGNQLIELSFIDNYSWKKLSLNLIEEVARLQQEEYMRENCRGKKYFLKNLDIRRKNGSFTKIWFCKAMSEKRGWQVTKSPPLNPPLKHLWWLVFYYLIASCSVSYLARQYFFSLTFSFGRNITLTFSLMYFSIYYFYSYFVGITRL